MWFITPENQILHSNSIKCFWTENHGAGKIRIFCEDGYQKSWNIGNFIDSESARDYLNNLYKQLGKG